ncbi:nb-arc domain containing protein [Lasius niger]|uniref:Nb-arc domain containing protein n=1 Tax=Lasius niger TaxID=67767 RepID=A0A0J7JV43_LASNI|nr:nb-arc domain containing protein [Lasius niger]
MLVNNVFDPRPKKEIHRLQVWGSRWPRHRSSSPDPLPRIQATYYASCYQRGMRWATILRHPHHCSLCQRDIFKELVQDVVQEVRVSSAIQSTIEKVGPVDLMSDYSTPLGADQRHCLPTWSNNKRRHDGANRDACQSLSPEEVLRATDSVKIRLRQCVH